MPKCLMPDFPKKDDLSGENASEINARRLLQQLRVNYLAELPDRIEDLEQRTLNLQHTSEFSQQFDDLCRKVHSLKGSAGTYGLQIISTICHQLEDTLAPISNDKVDEDFLDSCISYFDLMRAVILQAQLGQSVFPEIESSLANMRFRLTSTNLDALLVESSKVNSTLYMGALKSLPVKFSVVTSGYEALGLLLHKHFDLLITGYETTPLNGLALISAIRLNRGINQNITAILLTSSMNIDIPALSQPVTVLNRDSHTGAELFRMLKYDVKAHS